MINNRQLDCIAGEDGRLKTRSVSAASKEFLTNLVEIKWRRPEVGKNRTRAFDATMRLSIKLIYTKYFDR